MNTPDTDAGWYSEDAATFGDRLAAAREQAGLTQKKMASNLGVKTKTIANWEQDLEEPRANRLQMLAGLLNVSLTWLLTGQGEGPEQPFDTVEESVDIAAILTEMRALRVKISASGDKLAQLEKRLRAAIRDRP